MAWAKISRELNLVTVTAESIEAITKTIAYIVIIELLCIRLKKKLKKKQEKDIKKHAKYYSLKRANPTTLIPARKSAGKSFRFSFFF